MDDKGSAKNEKHNENENLCFVCVQLSIFLFASISYLTYARARDKKTVGMVSMRVVEVIGVCFDSCSEILIVTPSQKTSHFVVCGRVLL